jgi:hypothetical protein
MANVCDGVTTTASGTFSWTNNFNRGVTIKNAGTSWPLTQQPPINIGAGQSVVETVAANAAVAEYPYTVTFNDAVNGNACAQNTTPKIIIQVGAKKNY